MDGFINWMLPSSLGSVWGLLKILFSKALMPSSYLKSFEKSYFFY